MPSHLEGLRAGRKGQSLRSPLDGPMILDKPCGFTSISFASKITRRLGSCRPTVVFPSQAREWLTHCQMNKVLQTAFLLYLILEHLSTCVIKIKQSLDCEFQLSPLLHWSGLHTLLWLKNFWNFFEGLFHARYILSITQWAVGEITCPASPQLNCSASSY